ncbi:MAG: hypothetical protein AB1629_04100 [Candidatus Omnitrophota bacterium]
MSKSKCSVCSKLIEKGKAYKILKYKDKDYLVCCPLSSEVFESMPSDYSNESKPNIEYD